MKRKSVNNKTEKMFQNMNIVFYDQYYDKPAIACPSDWYCVSTQPKQKFSKLLFVKIGAPIKRIVHALKEVSYDYIAIHENMIVIIAKKPELWIGEGCNRIRALQAVTNGKIRLGRARMLTP